MLASAIDALGPWTWIILGLVLVGLELLAPGVFLVWLGLAAILTGLIDGMAGLSWQASALVFAALSLGCVLGGRALTGRPDEQVQAGTALNRRGHALVGRTFTLEAPILDGAGRVRVDDSSWRVIGPDTPAGASVRVVRVEGSTLVVEAV